VFDSTILLRKLKDETCLELPIVNLPKCVNYRHFIPMLFVCLFFAGVSPTSAEPSDGEKLMLKSTVMQHIASHTEGSDYLFVDNKSINVISLKFVAMHPVVFSHPNGTFVLCADFKNSKNEKVLIDYFVQKIAGKFAVLSEVEGKRSIITRIAEKFRL
jgi:hypothetical protein